MLFKLKRLASDPFLWDYELHKHLHILNTLFLFKTSKLLMVAILIKNCPIYKHLMHLGNKAL